MSDCCNGIIKSCGKDKNNNKLVWVHYVDFIEMSKKEIKSKIDKANDNSLLARNEKEVICLNTGVVYKSISQAAKMNNIAKQNIIACCKNKMKSAGKDKSTGKKLVWQYNEKNKKE